MHFSRTLLSSYSPSRLLVLPLLLYFTLKAESCPVYTPGSEVTVFPASDTIPLNSSATFSCHGMPGTVIWVVNTVHIRNTSGIVRIGIHYHIQTDSCNVSTIVLTPGSIHSNGTQIKCIILPNEEDHTMGGESTLAYLYLYENPGPPSNLMITQSGLDLHLSWEAPFSLEGEDITYIVRATNTRTGERKEPDLVAVSPQLVFNESIGERDCSLYEFKVYSVNAFGQSTTSETRELRIPTKPLTFQSPEAVSHNVDLIDGLSATLTFEAPHPCDTYYVQSYNLTFQEQNTPDHNIVSFTRQNNRDLVVIEVPAGSQEDMLQQNSVYLVTIVATNAVGSTVSGEITIYTTGLQSSSVMIFEVNDTASVTCNFALGSDALGCEVSFYTSSMSDSMELLFAQNITREPSSINTLNKNIPLMGQLEGRDIMNITVLTSEWLADESISSIEIEAEVTTVVPLLQSSTTTEKPTTVEIQATTADLNTVGGVLDNGDQTGFRDWLYIVIGGVVGVLLVGICLISILLVLVCLKRRRRKTTDFGGSQDLSTNYAYGTGLSGVHVFNCDPYYEEIHLSKQKLDEHYEEIPAGRTQTRSITIGSRNETSPDNFSNLDHQVMSVLNPIYRTTESYNNANSRDEVSVVNPVYSVVNTTTGDKHTVLANESRCDFSTQPPPQEDNYIVMQSVNGDTEARYTTVMPQWQARD